MQIKKDYTKMIEQFEKMEKEKQAAIPTISFDNNKIVHLPVDLLKPFPNHPFELYSGERFEDLADSIKACGMITPLLIRMLDDNTYQILAGHNRNNAAKAIGLETVPCIVLTDLTDDDALMIMLDSNTNQRSISEMSISQQAHIYALDVAVNKRQGKRSDLIKNIEQNLKIFSNGADLETCTPVGNKLKTVEIVGDKYGVSKNTIARLIRIDTLLPQLKKFIDNKQIPVRAGVEMGCCLPWSSGGWRPWRTSRCPPRSCWRRGGYSGRSGRCRPGSPAWCSCRGYPCRPAARCRWWADRPW